MHDRFSRAFRSTFARLHPETKAAIASVAFAPAVEIAFQTCRPFWEEDIGLHFEGMSPEERLRVAIEEGERVHPGDAREIEAGVSRAWGKVPFQNIV